MLLLEADLFFFRRLLAGEELLCAHDKCAIPFINNLL